MNAKLTKIVEGLEEARACTDGLSWLRKQQSPAQAWKGCKRGDWMLWALALNCEQGSEKHKKIVLAACECARSALVHIPDEEKRPEKAIETAEAWAKGKASLTEVKDAAADAAYAAAYAAADAADAAYAAAADAAYAAAYADAAAADAADADAAYAAAYADAYAAYAAAADAAYAAAADAAYAAAYADAADAAAAYAAAADAAYAAAYADAAADARTKSLAVSAIIVRKHFPKVSELL